MAYLWSLSSEHTMAASEKGVSPCPCPFLAACSLSDENHSERIRTCHCFCVRCRSSSTAIYIRRNVMNLLAVFVCNGIARRGPSVRSKNHAILQARPHVWSASARTTRLLYSCGTFAPRERLVMRLTLKTTPAIVVPVLSVFGGWMPRSARNSFRLT